MAVHGKTAKTVDTGMAVNSTSASTSSKGGCIRTLYLYSGPHRPDDGLESFMKRLGAECVCVDKEFDNGHDLLDQTFWESCMNDFERYDSYMASPPCSTFTPARRPDGGPKPLRGVSGPDRYGLRWLTMDDKKKVTEGTVMAVRAADMAWYAHWNGKWWIVEQPHEREGKTSMWKLDEFERLRSLDDVFTYTFDQCRFECRAQKRTDLLSNIPGLEEFTVLCNHEVKRWIIPWSGELVVAPHPPLRGRQWAILESQWDETMLRDREPGGDVQHIQSCSMRLWQRHSIGLQRSLQTSDRCKQPQRMEIWICPR